MRSGRNYLGVDVRRALLDARPTTAISHALRLSLTAIVVLFVAACASDPPGPSDPPSSTASPTPDGTNERSHEPTSRPVPSGLFDAAAVADAYGGFDEPGARFNSFPHMQWLSFCAEAFGFETTLENIPGSEAGLTAHVGRDQLERWAQVDRMCTDEAIRRGWVAPYPRTAEERRGEYHFLLRVNECLTALGYGTDPPSEDTFVEGADERGNSPVSITETPQLRSREGSGSV